MNWNDFYKSVKAGQYQSVYLFTGPEEHNKREALEALRRALLPAGLFVSRGFSFRTPRRRPRRSARCSSSFCRRSSTVSASSSATGGRRATKAPRCTVSAAS